jgi:predicted nucleic acid-binding protein
MADNLILDAGPLGMITHPRHEDNKEINIWLIEQIKNKKKIIIPEIADYELRRELLRCDRNKSIERLNSLKSKVQYLPISTEAMLKAAEFWSIARKRGMPTASDDALDGDVILAAQAYILETQGNNVIIVSDNVGHLSRYITAKNWREI